MCGPFWGWWYFPRSFEWRYVVNTHVHVHTYPLRLLHRNVNSIFSHWGYYVEEFNGVCSCMFVFCFSFCLWCSIYMNDCLCMYMYSTSQIQGIRLCKLHEFAGGDKRTCTLWQIHVYTVKWIHLYKETKAFTREDKHVCLIPCIWRVLYVYIVHAMYVLLYIHVHVHECSLCRRIGDEWLVTDVDTECYIPDVSEVCVCVCECVRTCVCVIHVCVLNYVSL